MTLEQTIGPWHSSKAGNDTQGLIYGDDGKNVAVSYEAKDAPLIAAAPDLYWAARCALADLEGIMPEFEPSGDREHPAWQTIKELRSVIAKVTPDEVVVVA
jgi:hypothetical protein